MFVCFSGIIKGEVWFEQRPILCSVIGAMCVESCVCSLLSIMCISIDRYVHICKNQVLKIESKFSKKVAKLLPIYI